MEFYIFCVCCGLWFAVICFLAGFCLGGVYYNDLCGSSCRNNPEPGRYNRGLDGSEESVDKK